MSQADFVSPRNSAALFTLQTLKPLSRKDFEDAIELRFREKGGLRAESATIMARAALSEFLADHRIQFGAEFFSWSIRDARKIADDHMECWEGD